MPAAPAICLNCQKPIKSGRADKKFCDSGCKDAYYNAIKTKEHKEIKKIDNILKRNRRILKKIFNPRSENKLISREVLIKAGFEFGFHTHLVITKYKANEFIFCYDYGYREVEVNKFQIIQGYNKVNVKSGPVLRNS
jgi:uncharacterized protein YvpB